MLSNLTYFEWTIRAWKWLRDRRIQRVADKIEVVLGAEIEEHATHCYWIHCRELANELIRRNPDRFIKLIEQIAREVEDLEHLSEEDLRNRIQISFKRVEDFIVLDTKCHVLYTDGFEYIEDLELEKGFHDLQMWGALHQHMEPVFEDRIKKLEEKEDIFINRQVTYQFIYTMDRVEEARDYVERVVKQEKRLRKELRINLKKSKHI